MLVEINLLPQKEAKNKTLLLLAVISITILLIGGFFVFWINRSNENKLANIEQQISTTEQLVADQQQKIVSNESSNSVTELENTVEWAQDYPIKAVPILKKLTGLLPERGFIQTFTYEEMGNITLGVQFESSREAVFYLNTLQESNWFKDAKLNNLDAITGFYDKTIGKTIDESNLKNEKYVPRYLGKFEITLNRDVIKDEMESESSEKKGGGDL